MVTAHDLRARLTVLAAENPRVPLIKQISAARSFIHGLLGVLRELHRTANPLKAFRLPDTMMVRKFLDVIGQQPVGKITVHAESVAGDQQESIAAWLAAIERVCAPEKMPGIKQHPWAFHLW